MATRSKRPAKRTATRKPTARRSPAAAAKKKPAARSASRRKEDPTASRRIAAVPANAGTLRVVWRPAIAMATLPYRVYRVYRWAEAQSQRGSAGPVATA